jgi:hypothetical protein
MKRRIKKANGFGISFRYAVFSKTLADTICIRLQEKEIVFSFNESVRDGSFVIIIDDIDKISFDAEFINKLNEEEKVSRDSFDFFIYLTSYEMMGGFSISSQVVDYIRIIGGNSIEVSYIII